MDSLLSVEETHRAPVAGVLARELDGLSNLFHGQVPYCTETTAATRTALDALLACVADEVTALALVDRGEDVVETDRAFEEGGQIGRLGGDPGNYGRSCCYCGSSRGGGDLKRHLSLSLSLSRSQQMGVKIEPKCLCVVGSKESED